MKELKLRLSDAEEDNVRRMLEDTGLANEGDLINNAITLLEWAIGERKQGREIASVDVENRKFYKARLPVLDNVTDFPRPMGRA